MGYRSILQRTKHLDIFDAKNREVKKNDEPLASSYRENNLTICHILSLEAIGHYLFAITDKQYLFILIYPNDLAIIDIMIETI